MSSYRLRRLGAEVGALLPAQTAHDLAAALRDFNGGAAFRESIEEIVQEHLDSYEVVADTWAKRLREENPGVDIGWAPDPPQVSFDPPDIGDDLEALADGIEDALHRRIDE